jgi:ABC-type glycerol-3-phosphate transport system substrate-binding protein
MEELLQDNRVRIGGGIAIVLILGLIIWAVFFQPKPTPQVPTPPVKLVWWKPFQKRSDYSDIISKFRSLPGNNNVTIEYVEQEYTRSGEYYKRILADIARGVGPDIFSLRNDDLPAYQQYLTPITGVTVPGKGTTVPEAKLLADYKTDFADLVSREMIIGDRIYGITSYIENLQLYYNQDILNQAGIAQPPTTWRELDNQLGRLNKRQSQTTGFDTSAISLGTGLFRENGDISRDVNISSFYEIMPMFLFQYGGQLYDYQTRRVSFSRDETSRTALGYYASFGDSQSPRFSYSDGELTRTNDNITMFSENKLAYMIGYSYVGDIIKSRNARLNFKVADLPQFNPDRKRTFGFYFADFLNRELETKTIEKPNDIAAKRKLQKAREFMYFLSLPDQQRDFVTKTNLPAARKDIVNEQLLGGIPLRIFANGSLYAENYYKPDVNRTERIWGELIWRVRFGGKTLDESIGEAVGEYRSIVTAGPRLR